MEAWNGTIIKQNSAVVLIFVPGKLPLSLLFLEHGLKQENKNELRHGNQKKRNGKSMYNDSSHMWTSL